MFMKGDDRKIKTVQVGVWLQTKEASALRALAEKEKRSLSGTLRMIICEKIAIEAQK